MVASFRGLKTWVNQLNGLSAICFCPWSVGNLIQAMRKVFIIVVYLVAVSSVSTIWRDANAAGQPQEPSPPAVALTPEQARNALWVLDDSQRRAQVVDTLRAVAATGALDAPASTAPGSASGAAPASGASNVLANSLNPNGLASQLSRQAGSWLVETGVGLRRSTAALFNVRSIVTWWRDRIETREARAFIAHVTRTVLLSIVPALLAEYLAWRLLARPRTKVAAHGMADAEETVSKMVNRQRIDEYATNSPDGASDAINTRVFARGTRHAERHWALLQRLPSALLYQLFAIIPLGIFVGVAMMSMSIYMDDNTTEARVVAALIDVYLLCRTVLIICTFFLSPHASGLRIIQMRNQYAMYGYRWVRRIVTVAGCGVALANGWEPLGLSDAAHLAILKIVTLVVHLLIAWVIFDSRRIVGESIRQRMSGFRSLAFVGQLLADVWASVAIFLVIAVWLVWALGVPNGYDALVHLGSVSLLVLVASRIAAIIALGALGRLFRDNDEVQLASKSIVQRHVYRYYPILRHIAQAVIGVATVVALLEVWGVHVVQSLTSGGVGNRLASAFVTIAIAAVFAVLIWETANVMAERRLEEWSAAGDRVRAARLRTLLPMMRTALSIVIAMVVVLTGLSELGVNTGPLIGSASIFGVALGFGSQKLVQDFITGIFLLMENAMQVGDWVTLAGASGTVEYLSIRTVRLRGGDGSLYTVPFSSVATVNNANRGIGNAGVRVSIALGQDVDLAISTLKQIGVELRRDEAFRDGILSDFSFWGIDAVDGSTVTLAGQMQCTDSARWPVQREFNRRVLNEFTARGIQMANPQRNFVIVNGNGAADMSHELQQDSQRAGAEQRGEPSKAAQHPTSEAAASKS